jgi:transposase, IS5 family
LERNLRAKDRLAEFKEKLDLFKDILAQKQKSKKKYYSIHEQEVECISKGKEHKKYEFGNKVSIIRTLGGLIIGAKSFRNEYDGHTIDDSLIQVERLISKRPVIRW